MHERGACCPEIALQEEVQDSGAPQAKIPTNSCIRELGLITMNGLGPLEVPELGSGAEAPARLSGEDPGPQALHMALPSLNPVWLGQEEMGKLPHDCNGLIPAEQAGQSGGAKMRQATGPYGETATPDPVTVPSSLPLTELSQD